VRIRREKVEALLDDVLARLECGAFDQWSFPSARIRELLYALAAHDRGSARERIRALGRHPHREARQAAQEARERLFGSPITHARNACHATGGPDHARAEHRVISLVTDLADEVENGGWLQWVANSTGATASQTLDALQEIAADQAAGELRKVIAALGPDGSSPNQRKRMKTIDKLMKAGRKLPEDEAMWSLSWDLRRLCCDYAEQHPDAFPRSVLKPDGAPPQQQ
jgi:hypothetical protein